MNDIKVVVGANFGDEGKGLMTDYFCHQATSRGKTCIVVMSNGGAQRGHTVNLLDGKKHVFNHFGSGTFVGADTYCPSEFILNPMQFCKELEDLHQLGHYPNVYVEFDCRWTTPFDMIINQIVEAVREDKKHGSCGMGIWETVSRYQTRPCEYSIYEFNQLPADKKVDYLIQLRDNYAINRLKEYKISDIPSEWKDIFYSKNLINHFIDDVKTFCSNTNQVFIRHVLRLYDTIVFENGQGLLLDENNSFYGDNTTPSNTGIFNSCRRIKSSRFKDANVEFCFVTRTYMTRHGAGKFITECNKDEINPNMFDETNVNNQFQDNLRYGHLSIEGLKQRIETNMHNAFDLSFPYKTSVAVTHTNEHQFDYSKLRSKIIGDIYTSDSKTRDSVQLFNEF